MSNIVPFTNAVTHKKAHGNGKHNYFFFFANKIKKYVTTTIYSCFGWTLWLYTPPTPYMLAQGRQILRGVFMSKRHEANIFYSGTELKIPLLPRDLENLKVIQILKITLRYLKKISESWIYNTQQLSHIQWVNPFYRK